MAAAKLSRMCDPLQKVVSGRFMIIFYLKNCCGFIINNNENVKTVFNKLILAS